MEIVLLVVRGAIVVRSNVLFLHLGFVVFVLGLGVQTPGGNARAEGLSVGQGWLMVRAGR